MATLTVDSTYLRSVADLNLSEKRVEEATNQLRQRTKFEIEENLSPILHKIEEEKKQWFSKRCFIFLVLNEFLKEAKEKPWTVASKVALIGCTIASFHPLVLSAIACLNAYRVENWNNIYSLDLNVANAATQLFSNLGHGVGYLVEGAELATITSCFLLRNSYKKSICRILENVYNKYIQDASFTEEERNFLYKIKRREMAYYGYFYSLPISAA